ncbi:ROK family protein, partial [Eggerthella sinensis]|uniref:ROK family protein n=1 Tax=Eggerthella sinensis TaxID=242230 RepID=UPI0022E81902
RACGARRRRAPRPGRPHRAQPILRCVGFGLAQMACIIDPDLFVLGGGLSERADLYLDAVRSRYRACALSVCRDTPIVASSLGNECGVYGAAFRAFELLDESAANAGDSRCAAPDSPRR